MFDTTSRAAAILKEKLLRSCYEAGIGFRIVVSQEEGGERTVALRLDMQREGDQILDAHGVRIFVDHENACHFSHGQLDIQSDDATAGLVYR
jgi:Fe-S cluster assembly iron-binding protein IscA